MPKYIEFGKLAKEFKVDKSKTKRVVELPEYNRIRVRKNGQKTSEKIPAQKFEMVLCRSGAIEKTIIAEPEQGKEDVRIKVPVKTTRPLLVATTPVTQAVWEYVMNFNPSFFQEREWKLTLWGTEEGRQKRRIKIKRDVNRPVECITWVDAIAFCNRLSELQGLTPYYNLEDIVYDQQFKHYPYFVYRFKNKETRKQKKRHMISARVTTNPKSTGYRLPTVFESELLQKDAVPSDIKTLGYDYGKFADEHFYPRAVAQGQPNSLGLYDVGDNVFEMLYDYDLMMDTSGIDVKIFNKKHPLNRIIQKKETDDEIRLNAKLSKADVKFLKKVSAIEDPAISPQMHIPTPFEFVGHFLTGNTNLWSKLPDREPMKNNETEHILTTPQCMRDMEIGFRIVRNIDIVQD